MQPGGDIGRLVWIRAGNCRKAALVDLVVDRLAAIVAALDQGQCIIELR